MKIHELEGHIQTIYLVEYPDKLLLLDGGCRCDVAVVRSYIEKDLQRTMADLKLVVVTHMHPDHAGGARLYQKRYRIPVASAKLDSQWYAGVKGSVQHNVDTLLAYWVAHRKKKSFRWLWYSKNLHPDVVLEDQQTLPGFDDWQVWSTPGHTDRDLSLLHPESRLVYVADIMLKVKGKFITPVPIKFPDRYRKTVKRLSQLSYGEVLMAHGGRCAVRGEDFLKLGHNVEETPQEYEVLIDIMKSFIKKTLTSR
ncbi:MBL fold metallo-hydrolase [Pseudobacteriovorax antillogorgiicola]|uniref:Glyoxylase, beta-lactamase superfamily II n=1 Tax=Pseudobacteriovorax antillogorgiicola TaxID=1513793 RepID=A0A1Y6BJM2_9BACT|nr:MBL fold metallo-hydrolase [Pseudobacteriovorax antillogorgiicola]TCS56371.1 glyoxylase-like metal-dependent hydrolase (beta-lactamase superfamily II) [Pseudobacteriovorax antillogorgiicola]SMF06584.1 Glyoxylase, beta-lactamase superfamily II [Pseudobacteriovorax antillogorgiicola]